jgi:hypothetical protein
MAPCPKARRRQTKLEGWRSSHGHANQNEKVSAISRDVVPVFSAAGDKPAKSVLPLADDAGASSARRLPGLHFPLTTVEGFLAEASTHGIGTRTSPSL